jgi:hypothetical protein
MRFTSLVSNLLVALVIFLGGQLLGAGKMAAPKQLSPSTGPRLHLRAGDFDPSTQTASLPQAAEIDDQPGLRLVQFPGPIQDAWIAALQACNLARVGYIPDYAYLVWGKAPSIECLRQAAPLRWHGMYRPGYALHPSLATTVHRDKSEGPELVDVIVQVYEAPETEASVRAVLEAAASVLSRPQSLLGYRVVGVRLDQARLSQIAALPGVVNVEPMPRFTLTDEVQGQIMAGNLTSDQSRPAGPGYLAWLAGLGFSTQPEDYPIVDVTDDGIDDGSVTPQHADFYQFGSKTYPDRLIYNVNWTSDPSAAGYDGHGNINASIVAGYNNLSGAAYADADGYHYGLGINPFGRVAGSKVFSTVWGWDLPNNDVQSLISTSYISGARISTNSWGAGTYGSYTWFDQAYDALVRDALESRPGNQEITIIFAAGNAGPDNRSTGSPGNAKNVITVGAAENYRPTWSDGCGVGPSEADSARDIASFSSRGPTSDGRTKPDLVAPGTHIQGAATQISNYRGYLVCDRYYPAGQTLYAASSGTSHSTPAVAGAASLFYHYYQQHFSADPPSPAMIKAYLVNSARYQNGLGANDDLPSASQGFGGVFLGRAFDSLPRVLVDQQGEFTQSGQVYTIRARVVNPGQPLRITLAWSDAPGEPYAAAYVNNLDLEVEVGGSTYLGNVFNGAFSILGGQADSVNNVESVFLPPGQSGQVLVRVRATNIAGDGVPNNEDITDQDFALVIYNAAQFVGTLKGMVTDQNAGTGIPDALIQAEAGGWRYRTTTDASGAYTLPLAADIYSVSAWKLGYSLESASDVAISDDQITTQDFALSPVGRFHLQGCITDRETGQGLAASLSVQGPFGVPVTNTITTRSDPCYQLDLFASLYSLHVESLLHLPADALVDLSADAVQDFALEATTLDGLLHGKVTDFNTDEPLSSAISAVPMPGAYPGPYVTTSDSDGAYSILLPADTYTLSVTAPLYVPLQEVGVVVPQSNVEERDFALKAPWLQVTPLEALRYELNPGERVSATLRLSNTGSAPLEFEIYETSGDLISGGPDPAGYVLLDSRVSRDVRYEWIDASDGTMLFLGDDDEVSVNLPFVFTFYGRSSNILLIGNNGAAILGVSTGDIPYVNSRMSSAPDDFIAPFWDDLDADYGWVAYKTVGTAPQRRFVVEWFNRPHYRFGSSGITAELILYEESNNLKFQYQDVIFDDALGDNGNSATVGIRGHDQSFLEYSYNSPKLANGMALCFQAPGARPCDARDAPWLTITPSNGIIFEQDVLTVTLQLDTDVSGLGLHVATVHLWGNDPYNLPYIQIPVRMLVHGFELFFPMAGAPPRPGMP